MEHTEYRLKKDIWVSDKHSESWVGIFVIKAGTIFEYQSMRGWCPKEENGGKYVFQIHLVEDEEYFEPLNK